MDIRTAWGSPSFFCLIQLTWSLQSLFLYPVLLASLPYSCVMGWKQTRFNLWGIPSVASSDRTISPFITNSLKHLKDVPCKGFLCIVATTYSVGKYQTFAWSWSTWYFINKIPYVQVSYYLDIKYFSTGIQMNGTTIVLMHKCYIYLKTCSFMKRYVHIIISMAMYKPISSTSVEIWLLLWWQYYHNTMFLGHHY